MWILRKMRGSINNERNVDSMLIKIKQHRQLDLNDEYRRSNSDGLTCASSRNTLILPP